MHILYLHSTDRAADSTRRRPSVFWLCLKLFCLALVLGACGQSQSGRPTITEFYVGYPAWCNSSIWPRSERDRYTLAYGRDIWLSDISLAVPRNVVIAIFGPAGSGKSEFCARLIAWPSANRTEVTKVTSAWMAQVTVGRRIMSREDFG
jgi:hypothetical protein